MIEVDGLRGRVNDVDSHEAIPAALWPENFGEAGETLLSLVRQPSVAPVVEDFMSDLLVDVTADELEIDEATIWRHEGWQRKAGRAPGAIDMNRRLDVLDFMGVQRQQVFPSFGLFGVVISTAAPNYLAGLLGTATTSLDVLQLRAVGKTLARAYNDWAIRQTQVDADRLRMVAVIDTSNFDEMMAETERVFAGGVRSLFIPASVPPGGKSPADRAMSLFWSLCEDADATVQLHLGFEHFMQTDVWGQIPEFKLRSIKTLEFSADPWTLATLHMPAENYLATMTLGGVFERHPRLRFGVIECGAHWIGPLAESLDMWAEVSQRQKQLEDVLSMRPSDYLARNVRVSPFWFEPIDMYLERYGLEDVYCYGSDYPHPEGGKDQIATLAGKLARLGDEIMEKFFITNAELIMPTDCNGGPITLPTTSSGG